MCTLWSTHVHTYHTHTHNICMETLKNIWGEGKRQNDVQGARKLRLGHSFYFRSLLFLYLCSLASLPACSKRPTPSLYCENPFQARVLIPSQLLSLCPSSSPVSSFLWPWCSAHCLVDLIKLQSQSQCQADFKFLRAKSHIISIWHASPVAATQTCPQAQKKLANTC